MSLDCRPIRDTQKALIMKLDNAPHEAALLSEEQIRLDLIQPDSILGAHWVGVSVGGLAWNQSLSGRYLDHNIADLGERAQFLCKMTSPVKLAQLARLRQRALELELSLLDWQVAVETSSGSRCPSATELLDLAISWGQSFLDWAFEKNLTIGDLRNLKVWLASPRNSAAHTIYANILQRTIQSGLSKTEALKAMELLTECIEMGRDCSSLLEANELSASEWFKQIKRLRFPETVAFDEQRQQALDSIALGRGAKLNWSRQGDRAFLEFSVQLNHGQDFERACDLLRKAKTELEQKDPTYWSAR